MWRLGARFWSKISVDQNFGRTYSPCGAGCMIVWFGWRVGGLALFYTVYRLENYPTNRCLLQPSDVQYIPHYRHYLPQTFNFHTGAAAGHNRTHILHLLSNIIPLLANAANLKD
jgi:hypothetical protein